MGWGVVLVVWMQVNFCVVEGLVVVVCKRRRMAKEERAKEKRMCCGKDRSNCFGDGARRVTVDVRDALFPKKNARVSSRL